MLSIILPKNLYREVFFTENLKKALIMMCFPVAVLMLVLSVLLCLPKTQAAATPAAEYVLKDYGGNPALFYSDNEMPVRVYPTIYTHLLPRADAENLQNGIEITTEEQLRQLIEDFDG